MVWVGEGDVAAPPNLMVTRRERRLGEDVATLAMRDLMDLAQRDGVQLLASYASRINGQPAYRALARWSVQVGRVTQARAWIASDGPETLALICS